MNCHPDTTRERILTSAYAQFYKNGFARVSMDAIAAAAGLTKRSLYYHFESKDRLLEAVLEKQQGQALELFRSWVAPTANSPGDFVNSLFQQLNDWCCSKNWTGSGYTRLTMELADMPGHPAREAARRHKVSAELCLSASLSELGVQDSDRTAREIMLLIEGAMSLTLIHGPPDYIDAAARAARALVDLPHIQ